MAIGHNTVKAQYTIFTTSSYNIASLIFYPLDNSEEITDLLTVCRHVGRFKGLYGGLLQLTRAWRKHARPMITAGATISSVPRQSA